MLLKKEVDYFNLVVFYVNPASDNLNIFGKYLDYDKNEVSYKLKSFNNGKKRGNLNEHEFMNSAQGVSIELYQGYKVVSYTLNNAWFGTQLEITNNRITDIANYFFGLRHGLFRNNINYSHGNKKNN